MEYRLYDEIDCDEADWEFMDDLAQEFKHDLKRVLDDTDDVFIVFGAFGRWDGPVHGGCIVETVDDLAKFLSFRGIHYDRFVDNDGELEITQSHHDGSNHYVLRKLSRKGLQRYRNHLANVGQSDGELIASLATVEGYTKKARIAKEFGYC